MYVGLDSRLVGSRRTSCPSLVNGGVLFVDEGHLDDFAIVTFESLLTIIVLGLYVILFLHLLQGSFFRFGFLCRCSCWSFLFQCKPYVFELLGVFLRLAKSSRYVCPWLLLGALLGFLLFLESFFVCLKISYFINVLLNLYNENLGLLNFFIVEDWWFGEFFEFELPWHFFTRGFVKTRYLYL